MHTSPGRARRRALVTTTAVLITGLAFSAAPSTAATLAAVEPFDATTTEIGDSFPDEAMLGERVAFASDQLLLSTASNQHSYRRVTNSENTALATLAQPDPGAFPQWDRERIVDAAATASGNFTAPFAERSLILAATVGGSDGGGILQLTSPSDVAEPVGEYTTYGESTATPETGKTYLIRTRDDLADTTDPGLMTSTHELSTRVNAAQDYSDAASVLAQQWTVVEHGTSDSGEPQYQFVNRSDGACLMAPSGRIIYTHSAVCSDDEHQLFELREDDGNGRTTLHSVYYNEDIYLQLNNDITLGGFYETQRWWGFVEVQQPDPIPASVAFDVENRDDVVFDLAVGDLDGVTGAETLGREEAAVAYVDPDGELVLAVVDYNANDSGRLVTSVDTGITLGTTNSGALLPLSVDVADVDEDGIAEMVVVYGAADGRVTAAVADYTAGDAGDRELSLVGTQVTDSTYHPMDAALSADAAVFDFNGDGIQEIAWVGPETNSDTDVMLRTSAIQVEGSEITVTTRFRGQLDDMTGLPAGANPNSRVRVESGQFVETIDGSGSRQIAASFETVAGQQAVTVIRLRADGEVDFIFDDPVVVPTVTSGSSVSMAVGGFAGGGGGDSSQWGIALSTVGGSASSDQLTLIQPTEAFADPVVNRQSVPINGGSALDISGFDLTSYDPGGQTLELGTPVVFTVEKLVSMSLVGGQPPAHSDWLGGRFLNISRNTDFNLAMGTQETTVFTNETSQESNQTYNLSTELDVKASIEEGVPFIEKGELSGEVSGKFDYSWGSLGKSTSGASWSTDYQVKETTDDDDIVNAIVQDFQVTRYPVISVDSWNRTDAATSGCDEGCYGYWDVVVPGEPHQADKSGKGNKYFTAPWQNGNALSYPQLDQNGEVPLTDVGTFTSIAADGTETTGDATLLNQEFGIGGNETTVDLNLSNSGTESSSETSNKGWDLDLNVEGGVSGKIGIPFLDNVETEASLSGGFNTEQMFTGSVTGSTANTHGATFELNVPEVDANLGYGFGVAYYYGTDGAPRVTYGVDLTSNEESREFWLRSYGQKPDPALNQPYSSLLRYNPIGYLGATQWNPLLNRQEMRGFTVRQPESDNPTTSGATYADSPEAGDPVVFDIQVSNYSLVPLNDPLTVDFIAVPTDSDGLTVTGEPVEIGRRTVSDGIGAQEHITVSSPEWTARGTEAGGAQSWRIFAVLDQDDTIDEIHEWEGTPDTVCPESTVQGGFTLTDPMTGETETLVCGQNNQGFGTVTVAAASDTVSTADASSALATESAQIGLAGAGVLTSDNLTEDSPSWNLDADSEVPTVTTDVPSTVVIRADAERETTGGEIVMVYEGDPADGELVAVQRLGGVPATGTVGTTFQYTPETDGLHELHAVLLASDDTSEDRGLIVRVNAVADDTIGDGDGDGDGDGSDGGSGDGSDDGGSGTDTDGSGADPSEGDLATTGQEGWPWLVAGVIGALLIAAGVLVGRSRAAHRR
ncbi:MAG: hypothetical protein ACQEW8_15185 [Actinomycetota bacterium]